MKALPMILVAILILILGTSSFAEETFKHSTRQEILAFNNTKASSEKKLAGQEAYFLSQAYKYNYDVSSMDRSTLIEFIEHQQEYIQIKKPLVEKLAKIYFHNEKNSKIIDPLDDITFLRRIGKCNIWQKIALTCPGLQVLVLEAKHLDQVISDLNTMESSLSYAISNRVIDEDKDSQNILISKNIL